MAMRAATGFGVVLLATIVFAPLIPAAPAMLGAWCAGITLLVPGVRPRPTLPILVGAAIGVAVLLGNLAGTGPILLLVLSAAWALAMAFIGSLGSAIGSATTVCGVTFVLAASISEGNSWLLAAGAAVFGGVVQGAATLLPPWSRFRPERLGVAHAFRELAEYSRGITESLNASLPTKSLLDASTVIGERRRVPHVLREVTGQLYELRAALIAVGVARARLLDEDPMAARQTGRVLRESATALDRLAEYIVDQKGLPRDWEEDLAASIDAAPSDESGVMSTRHTVAGQEVRRLQRALQHTARLIERVVRGEPATTVVSRRIRVRSRFSEEFQTIRANLSPRSPAFQHAIRAAMVIAAATGAGLLWPGDHGFWLPLTAWIVLRPDFAATVGRGIERTLGTTAGVVVATALAFVVENRSLWAAATILVFAMLAYLVLPVSFFVFSAAVAGFAVFQLDFAAEANMSVALERGLATLLGGLVAIGLYWLLPTWQTRRLPELMADLIEAYRDYANLVLQFQARPLERDEKVLRDAVDEVRLRRSELNAATEQATIEPIGGPRPYSEDIRDLEAVLERAARSLIVMEGGVRRGDAAQLPGIDEFEDAIDAAYHRLAEWVRTGRAGPEIDLDGAVEELDVALGAGSPATRRRRRVLDWESDVLVDSLKDAGLIVAEWQR
ncbi:putative membrane protein YccC [Stackebrandtia albiflava]|uniref:Putative membrane protein YccC n=2 Tax=Stackebrandtia albiflava TaxID=406432 RepID=A0A562UYB5_9ACTN|nr:putative membrane protein YccC [Stackebrandtia albiflava]